MAKTETRATIHFTSNGYNVRIFTWGDFCSCAIINGRGENFIGDFHLSTSSIEVAHHRFNQHVVEEILFDAVAYMKTEQAQADALLNMQMELIKRKEEFEMKLARVNAGLDAVTSLLQQYVKEH